MVRLSSLRMEPQHCWNLDLEEAMGSEGIIVASILSAGGVIITAILKFTPSNGNKVCQAHSGLIQCVKSIDKRLDEIQTTLKALK